jgi:GNAT superfamily N-acetyltransferase
MKIRSILQDECDALGGITVAAFRQLMAGEELGGYEAFVRDVTSRSDDSEFSDPEAAGIRMLAVDPEHQGTGIGVHSWKPVSRERERSIASASSCTRPR